MGAQRKPIVIGTRFGQLTLLGELPDVRMPSGTIKRIVEVQCDCGNKYPIQLLNLTGREVSRCLSCAAKARPGKQKQFLGNEVNAKQAFRAYQRSAKRRSMTFALTMEQFLEISQQDCHYCGIPPSNIYDLKLKDGAPRASAPFIYSGIDRVDYSSHYEINNVVPCCVDCNKAKSDMSHDQFINWFKRANSHLIKQGILK